jgi:methylated-DNA-protein-cysteine methyltransferase related protein
MIPAGKVATYGQIAELVGGCTARMAGYAMAAVPDGSDVPWHRVINSKGGISLKEGADEQRFLLESEGVQFKLNGLVDLAEFGWDMT